MKLLTKYNRINIGATIFIFLIGSCTFYFLLRYILVRELDATLKSEKQEIMQFNAIHHALPDIVVTKEQTTAYFPAPVLVGTSFNNRLLSSRGHEEYYRQIQFGVEVKGNYYLVTVNKPLEETEDLLQVIIIVTSGMIALILLVAYFINRRVLNSLWRPFHQTIESVKKYKLTSQETLQLGATSIDEFSMLNQSISGMTERVQQDYHLLKEFTGHAAHEMQTPLAVIRSKLDMLIQNENLLQGDSRNILEIEAAVNRLARLNQSLLLLTKVENRQFVLNEEIRLDKIIEEKCAELSEMMRLKYLTLAIESTPIQVYFHQQLAEIIVSNLLNNAIRYNMEGGSIQISLTENSISITNTSGLPALDEEKVFQRFYRHRDTREEGNGLGLSIVKEICELAGFNIAYEYQDNNHIFTIVFNKKSH